jgi:hypothetical protein
MALKIPSLGGPNSQLFGDFHASESSSSYCHNDSMPLLCQHFESTWKLYSHQRFPNYFPNLMGLENFNHFEQRDAAVGKLQLLSSHP